MSLLVVARCLLIRAGAIDERAMKLISATPSPFARKVRIGLADLARTIGSSAFAVRDQFGLADISAGSALGYLDIRWPEIDWRSDHPNLANYAEALFARASFRATTPTVQHIRDQVV